MFEEMLRAIVREEVSAAIRAAFRANNAPAEPTGEAEFVSVKTAATMLSVSTATIHNWAKQGRLPKCAIGGAVRIKRSDLRALAESSAPKAPVNVESLAREMLARGR